MGSINTSFGSPAKLVTKCAHMLQMAAYNLGGNSPEIQSSLSLGHATVLWCLLQGGEDLWVTVLLRMELHLIYMVFGGKSCK